MYQKQKLYQNWKIKQTKNTQMHMEGTGETEEIKTKTDWIGKTPVPK